MKKIILLFALTIPAACQLFACEIRLSVLEDSKKDIYEAGDTLIIQAQVQLTHRVCAVELKKTKFTYENLKILGATDWKEIKPGLYSRQIKALVTNEKTGQAKISALRTCDKEGGYDVCILGKL